MRPKIEPASPRSECPGEQNQAHSLGKSRVQRLRVDREGRSRTAYYSQRHTTSACASWRVADIYQIAKNCRTSVERMEKYYAAHIKTALDAVAINLMRSKKNKNMNAEQEATQNAQA